MATLKDIARAAGVSIATVSNVVNGTKSATPAVRRRVLEAIELLGYVPNPHAQTLRTGQSHTLGLVVPDLTNPFFPALVQAIEARARERGHVLIVMDAGNDAEREQQALSLLASYRVAGVIWVPVDDRRAPTLPFPLVTVDRAVPGCDAVVADHAQGGALIAEHALAQGHRQIGLLAGPQQLPSAAARRRGFVEALDGHATLAWEYEVPFDGQLPPEVERRLVRPQCSLVVCANDAVAVAVVRRAREVGLLVPADLAVTGFDDVPWADFVDPALTTVRQPLGDLGARAVDMLRERIDRPDRPPRHETLPVALVVRRSSALQPAASAPHQEGAAA